MEFKILLMEKFTTWSSGSSAVGGGTGRPVKRLDLSSFQDKRLLFKTNWRNNTGSKSVKVLSFFSMTTIKNVKEYKKERRKRLAGNSP